MTAVSRTDLAELLAEQHALVLPAVRVVLSSVGLALVVAPGRCEVVPEVEADGLPHLDRDDLEALKDRFGLGIGLVHRVLDHFDTALALEFR